MSNFLEDPSLLPISLLLLSFSSLPDYYSFEMSEWASTSIVAKSFSQ